MKYRLIKDTDGLGVERVYAQIMRRVLFFNVWYYLSHPSCDLGGAITETIYPLHKKEDMCTEDMAIQILEKHKERMERERLERLPHKIQILKTFCS